MGRTDTIDPKSLKEGDRVEVCMCDTSATCVWSYAAEATKDEKGKLRIEAIHPNHPNHVGEHALRPKQVDGCYTYLRRLTPAREKALR